MRFALAVALLSITVAARVPPAISIDVTSRAIQPGEVLRVALETSVPADALELSVFDRSFPAARTGPSTWEALIGVDLDVPSGPHTLTIAARTADGTVTTSRTLDVQPRTFRTRRLTVEPRYVEPPPDVTARIVEEAGVLNTIWDLRSPERLWSGGFKPPVPDPANSAFGSRSIFNGQPRSPHGGADFASPGGRVVRAANGGRVVLARDLYFTGGTIVVDHGLGLLSLFAHLSSIDVANGTLVSTGDAIGRVGATGRVTGPHLHWTVRLAGTRVDPLSLMEVTNMAPAAGASPRRATAGP
jgi:hypothetical protein